jgi:CBS domain-containing protein/sporulation protein YlmC with PRC-barrel domain
MTKCAFALAAVWCTFMGGGTNMTLVSVYLSRILGKKIYLSDDTVYGKLKDLAVDMESKNPKVVAAQVKTPDGLKNISWDNITMIKEKGQYTLKCSEVSEIDISTLLHLRKYVLDQQIIDVNGKKVVRVNDIRLVSLQSGLFVAAVDIGLEGLLRRLDLAKPLKKLGFNIPGKLMLWNDVEPVVTSKNIALSKTYNKLSTLHPSDLADIIEDFDSQTGRIIFSILDKSKAADVLEELEDKAQVDIITSLSTDKAADILEEMPADEVADILDSLEEKQAEELLNNMEKEASDEVRELMEYDEELVGSFMSSDFIAFPRKNTVFETLNMLKDMGPEEEEVQCLYVVNDLNKLVGIISPRDLMLASPEQRLEQIMSKKFIFMYDTDKMVDLVREISKYNLIVMPVVDENMVPVGNVIITDILGEILRSRKRYLA